MPPGRVIEVSPKAKKDLREIWLHYARSVSPEAADRKLREIAIETERIEVTISVPAIYWLAINQANFGDFKMSSVRTVAYGGAPMAPDLIARVIEAGGLPLGCFRINPDRKSTRLNSSHVRLSRMPSSA